MDILGVYLIGVLIGTVIGTLATLLVIDSWLRAVHKLYILPTMAELNRED